MFIDEYAISIIVLTQLYIKNLFFFNDTATTEIYTLSLHDALPISHGRRRPRPRPDRSRWASRRPSRAPRPYRWPTDRSEEHTSELQSPCNLVCRLLLEKKKLIPIAMRLRFFRECYSKRRSRCRRRT